MEMGRKMIMKMDMDSMVGTKMEMNMLALKMDTERTASIKMDMDRMVTVKMDMDEMVATKLDIDTMLTTKISRSLKQNSQNKCCKWQSSYTGTQIFKFWKESNSDKKMEKIIKISPLH